MLYYYSVVIIIISLSKVEFILIIFVINSVQVNRKQENSEFCTRFAVHSD